MWWCRATNWLLAAVLLGGCGFQPLYGGGKSGPIAMELSSIKIGLIADRSGQILRNHLMDKLTPFGQPAKAKYALKVTMNEGIASLAVKKSKIATRANLRVTANFVLTQNDSGESLFNGSSSVVASYNVLSENFSTLIAEKDARGRAINGVAENIQNRLAAYFRLHPEADKPTLP